MFSQFKKLLVLGLFAAFANPAWAAPPSLNINQGDFRYTASVTAVLLENCTELADPNDILMAYVKGQLRGYVQNSTAVGSRYMSFLTVYSNQASGDTVVFKIYQAATDKTLNVKTLVIFSDDGVYGNPSQPLELHTNNRPSNLQLSTKLVPERPVTNANLATISAQDLDKDNTLSYALVAGTGDTDNGLFQVTGNQLQVKGNLNTAQIDSFHIRLRATDNLGCPVEKEFTLIVDKVNDAPFGLHISDSLFFENIAGPKIGQFHTDDLDLVDRFTYSFVAGNGDVDNSKFAIYDSSLYFKASANYETKRNYTVRIRTTDAGGLFYDKAFTLYVKDNNDPPTNLLLSNTTVYENEAADQFVARMSTVDEDAVDKYTYTFANIGTNDNFSFTIDKDTLRASKVFDFETKNSYIVYLTSTDSSGIATTKFFTITIKDTLDAPTDMMINNSVITENAPKGTFVGALSTVDAKSAGTYQYTYTLVSGTGSTDNSRFYLSNDTLYNNEAFDYEKNKSFSVRVKAALINGMSVEKAFVINVKDVSATNIVLSNRAVYENESKDQFVAVISTVSQDLEKRYEYSFGNVGTNDNNSFTLSNDTLRASRLFDYETKSSYVIYLTSTDSSNVSITKVFAISIKDTLDVPTDIVLSNASISESLPANTFIGRLNTLDANTPPVNYAYTTVAGQGDEGNASFRISNDSLYSNEVFDFEKKTSYSIRLRSTLVNKMFVEKTFLIGIKDIASNDIALSNDEVYENEAKGQFVGKISTISLDTSDSYQYTFANIGTNDNTSFRLLKDSLFANKVFDYETKNSYVIYLISTSLSGSALTRSFAISIKDSLDQPTDLNLSNAFIDENLPAKTFIGLISTVDNNTPPVAYAYRFVLGNGSADSSSFLIRQDSLYSNERFDAETKALYHIRIRSTLVNGMYVEKAFNIIVPNTNEQPTFLSLSKDTIAENTADSSLVGTFSSVDQDKGETFRYSLVAGDGDADNKAFAIRNIRLVLVKAANYEKKSSYKIRVRTEDSQGLFLDTALVIHIKDLNEQPKITIQGYEISELADPNTTIGHVEITDEDKKQSYNYQIMNPDVPFKIDASTGLLSLSGAIDYEKKTSYDVLIKVTDSGIPALSDSTTLTIKVLDEIEDDLLPSADLVSPNGDGKNDTWKIRNVYLYKDFSLEIVDQNSQLVYSVDRNYDNDWDAKYNGEVLPNGIYYYVFKSNTDGKLFKGYITVLK